MTTAYPIVLRDTHAPTLTHNRSGADTDAHLVSIWVRGKQSTHTRRAYTRDAHVFLGYMATRGLTLHTVTVAAVQDWIDTLQGKIATRARKVASMRSLLSFGQKTGYLTHNVGAVLNPPKVPNELAQRMLSESEAHRLLAGARMGRDAVLIHLMYASGGRVAEISALQWKHVNRIPGEGAILTIHGKGAKTRFVRISEKTAIELDTLRGASTPEGYVFVTRTGKPVHPRNMRKTVASIARRVGIDRPVSPHWFRHAHASHALDRGTPVHVVQATLGHATLATTSKYAHVKPTESSALNLGI